MSYYFLAQIRIDNETEYQQYIDRAGEVFQRFNGTYLAVDGEPLLLEGNWDYTRMVLIRFDSKEDFNAWYRSAEYQKILKYRLKAARCDTILVKGLSQQR
jgi:uncharacterized protein (DUF1330 family)